MKKYTINREFSRNIIHGLQIEFIFSAMSCVFVPTNSSKVFVWIGFFFWYIIMYGVGVSSYWYRNYPGIKKKTITAQVLGQRVVLERIQPHVSPFEGFVFVCSGVPGPFSRDCHRMVWPGWEGKCTNNKNHWDFFLIIRINTYISAFW